MPASLFCIRQINRNLHNKSDIKSSSHSRGGALPSIFGFGIINNLAASGKKDFLLSGIIPVSLSSSAVAAGGGPEGVLRVFAEDRQPRTERRRLVRRTARSFIHTKKG